VIRELVAQEVLDLRRLLLLLRQVVQLTERAIRRTHGDLENRPVVPAIGVRLRVAAAGALPLRRREPTRPRVPLRPAHQPEILRLRHLLEMRGLSMLEGNERWMSSGAVSVAPLSSDSRNRNASV